jgi:hypothetical protein
VISGYKICVYTGDDKDAGTKANAYIKLFGTKGRTDQLHLRKSETNDVQFQPGQVHMNYNFSPNQEHL